MRTLRIAGGWLAALVILVSASPIASAQDADTQEISRYTLTDAGLAKYTSATQKLAAIPGACAREDDEDSESHSLDEMVAKLNAVPGAKAAIQSAGVTTREYVVFSWSMLQTGMAAWAQGQSGGKLPPGVSQANVDFFKKHEAEMAALGENDPCGDDPTDDVEVFEN
jgi:hypothetical protein